MGSLDTEAFPSRPTDTIEWAKLTVDVQNVNGHVESRFSLKTGVWSTPRFVSNPLIQIHGLAPALNYGQQAYEGLKAFRSPNNEILIFRPDFHAERMTHSASHVSIPAIAKETFLSAVNMAVAYNAEFVPPADTSALLYIRPVVFGSSPNLGLTPPTEYIFAVYVCPANSYHGMKPLPAVILEDFDRAAPNGTGSAKVGGNYAPVIRHGIRAHREGFPVTLHLDSKTHSEIDEFSTSGFLGVKHAADKGETTLVVPDSKNIINSVTSDSCLKIGKSFGWTIEKRAIKYEELGEFSEVIAVGTAASLLPVRSITHRSKGDKFKYVVGADGEPGPAHQQLSKALADIQKGLREDQFRWTVKATAPPA